MASNRFDTNLPMSGPGFCQIFPSSVLRELSLLQPVDTGEGQSRTAPLWDMLFYRNNMFCGVKQITVLQASTVLLLVGVRKAQKPNLTCWNKLVSLHRSTYFIPFFFFFFPYMTWSCCYILYFMTAPSVEAKTLESELNSCFSWCLSIDLKTQTGK